MSYSAPTKDMSFLLREICEMATIAQLPGFEEATPDLVETVLEESGKLAAQVIAPLNHSGDRAGSVLENGVVRTPTGFREAYGQFVEGGWNALPFDPDYGGQGLPWSLAIATHEMLQSANLAFSLAPLLTIGSVHLLHAHGTADLKELYLPKLISGEWTGTMNLTEPQAGSDVGALKTKAEKHGDHYLIRGQKIFITWGDHDCAENIIHMVLARTEGAPEGTKGISLFLVPKFLPDADGNPGQRNDLHCVSLEHKLGINASPTAVMAYGDNEGAIGYLVGEECQGMVAMFTMMNNARLSVGTQGVAIAERAYQQALSYARERRQGRALDAAPGEMSSLIIEHPDVRRMLITMKALTEGGRALCYLAAATMDRALAAPSAEERAAADRRFALLTPLVKAWCTDAGCRVADLGIQVHGGVGFIEETGAAQHYRDARILPIYEGTNGIQGLDLLSRKLLRDSGTEVERLQDEIAATAAALTESTLPALATAGLAMARALETALEAQEAASTWLLSSGPGDPLAAAAGATPYCQLFGTLVAGWLLAKSALAAADNLAEDDAPGKDDTPDRPFLESKIKTAHFFAVNVLPHCAGLAENVTQGAPSCLALDPENF